LPRFALKRAGYNAGLALQRNNNGGTIKFVKATFTKGTRRTILFDTTTNFSESTDTFQSIDALVGHAILDLPTPVDKPNASSVFMGWFDAATGGTAYTNSTVMTAGASLTLYTHWETVVARAPIVMDFTGMSIGSGFASIGGNATTVSAVTANSFTYATNSGYSAGVAIKVSLGVAKLSEYDKITFTVTAVSGDTNNKSLAIAGGLSVPGYVQANSGNASLVSTYTGSPQNLTDLTNATITDGVITTPGTSKNIEFTIDKTKAINGTLTGDIYLALFVHNAAASYTISNFQIFQNE